MKGFEPPTPSLPWKCSTPELHWLGLPQDKEFNEATNEENIRAGDETRTRDPQLGRLMLYQLSYARTLSASRNRREPAINRPFQLRWRYFFISSTFGPFEPTFVQLPITNGVGAIGFEPIQTESPDLQSGPALPLRRAPRKDLRFKIRMLTS